MCYESDGILILIIIKGSPYVHVRTVSYPRAISCQYQGLRRPGGPSPCFALESSRLCVSP